MFTPDTMYNSWSEAKAFFERAVSTMKQASDTIKILLPRPSPETEVGLMARLLNVGARVIAPDLRGHGASDKPTDPEAYRDWAMARDVIGLLDHLGLETVDAMGYSMGSIMLLRLLGLGEKRIRSVILGGVGPWISVQGVPMPDWSDIGEALPPGLPLTWEAWTENAAAVMLGTSPSIGIAGGQAQLADAIGFDRRVAAAVIHSEGERIAPEALKGVDVLVLVLNGDEDPQKYDEREFAGIFPDVRFGSARGDHMSALFDPDFQREVIEFLQWRWNTAV